MSSSAVKTKPEIRTQFDLTPWRRRLEADAVDPVAAAERWYQERVTRSAEPWAEVVSIGPNQAAVLLRNNPDNRNIVPAKVARWARMIGDSQWQVNGESVKVARTGELNDGQHRLTAAVQTGLPITTVIVWGVERDSRMTVDRGDVRTIGSMLTMAGYGNGTSVSATAKMHINLRTASWLRTERTVDEVIAEIEAFPDLQKIGGASTSAARSFKVSTALFNATYKIGVAAYPERADTFFSLVATGVGIPTDTHPTAMLRNRLTANLRDKSKLPLTELAPLLIKAWNAFIEDRPVYTLRWGSKGANTEAFPVMLGLDKRIPKTAG